MSRSRDRRVGLVTGASTGIGVDFARLLAERGHDLILVARDAERLEKVGASLRADHGIAYDVLSADLTEPDDLARVEARCADQRAPIDILVNNAGFGTGGRFHQLDVDWEEREVRLNVLAVVRLTHAAARTMVQQGRGAILNVSSMASFQPGPRMATYCATKAFVTSFTQAVHDDLIGTGVRATVVCPGFMQTEFQTRLGVLPGGPAFMWQSTEGVARAALDAVARNRPVEIPGALQRVVATASGFLPTVFTRQASKFVLRQSARS